MKFILKPRHDNETILDPDPSKLHFSFTRSKSRLPSPLGSKESIQVHTQGVSNNSDSTANPAQIRISSYCLIQLRMCRTGVGDKTQAYGQIGRGGLRGKS